MSTTGNAPTTFSSAHMRERDKIIREKHDKEISALHSKIHRIRYSNDDLRKQVHDVEERARRLSNALGFEDFVDAQVCISTADQGVSYKECFEQVGSLRAELEAANFEVESLKAQIALADQERGEFNAKLDASRKLEQEARKSSRSEATTLRLKTFELQQQYDNLRNKYDRATDLYKADYKKWRKFDVWLFSKHEDGRNMSGGNICPTVMRKKRKLQEMLDDGSLSNDTDCPPLLGGLTNPYLEEDEDQVAAQHVQNFEPRPFPVSPLILSPSSTRLNTPASPGLNAAAKPKPIIGLKKPNNMPLHSPSVFLDMATGPKSVATRGSVVYKPVPDAVPHMREPEPSPSRVGIIEQNRKDDESIDEVFVPSSETEEDSGGSQSFPPASGAAKVLPSVPCSSDSKQDLGSPPQRHGGPLTASQSRVKTIAYSSDTEPDTQRTCSPAQHTVPLPTPLHPLPPVFKMPKVPQLACSSDSERDIQQSRFQQHNLPLPTPKSLARSAPVFRLGKRDVTDDGHNNLTEPPHKIRRVGVMQTPKRSLSSYRSNTSPRSGSSRKVVAGNYENRFASQSSRRRDKRENKENTILLAVSTPVSTAKVLNTPAQDYSAFKGRGRYAKDMNSTTKTINAIYAVDSSRNGGVEHPYDEVVRRKEDRKKMDAGDCECCHEYYEAVGPLPSLMQPPLWRSPETKKKKTHKRHVSDSHALLALNSSFDLETSSILKESQDPPFSQFGSNTDKHHSGIEDHKRLISRHRHHWARAVTPPGYWDIGFPSTQETEKINEKAKEMHRKKQFEVDRSVRAGEGKYRRR
ncbi:hypothetical protein JOM56_009214 [Amanita muscaria]